MNPPAVQDPTAAMAWPESVRRAIVEALAIVDSEGVCSAPGAILLDVSGCRAGLLRGPARVLAVGKPDEVGRHPGAQGAVRVVLPECILIPGLANAHCHLDLTVIGPRPFDEGGGFAGWIEMVRRQRPTEDGAIMEAVRRGIDLSIAGGTVAIGDIAGAPAGKPNLMAWRTLAGSDLIGTSFLEYFAIGRGEAGGLSRAQAALEGIDTSSRGVRLGLQPHAPNTVSLRGYEWALTQGLPLATHLAETIAEREFTARGTGPQREFLERIGLWDDEILAWAGRGDTPVRHLTPILARGRFVLAHVNDASDAEIELLARTGQAVAYCPRASEYFGNQRDLGPHRYRDMIAAGIPVALGTDSIINLPTPAADPQRGGMSIFDEMRCLWQRDRADPEVLLRMATVNGATTLGLDPAGFRFVVGENLQGLVALRAGGASNSPSGFLEHALVANSRPQLLLIGK